MIDDVLSLLALSISTDVVSGTVSAGGIAVVALKAIAFIVIAGAFGLLVVTRFMERLDSTPFAGRFPEFLFIFAMMMAFLYAMLAEVVGLSAIVGAFIAGVSFEGVRLHQSRNLKEGAEYLQIIFASIFFVSLGILADFHALTPKIVVFLNRPHHRCHRDQSDRLRHTGQTFRTVHKGCAYCRVWYGTPWRSGDDRSPHRA